jgi:hypothetical protein
LFLERAVFLADFKIHKLGATAAEQINILSTTSTVLLPLIKANVFT